MTNMSLVRGIIATILATTLAISIILAEIDEAFVDTGSLEAVDPATAQAAIEEAVGPLNFDSTFLLLSLAIIILVVPDAIAYVRRKKQPEGNHGSREPEAE